MGCAPDLSSTNEPSSVALATGTVEAALATHDECAIASHHSQDGANDGLNTGFTSTGELAMILRISAVAAWRAPRSRFNCSLSAEAVPRSALAFFAALTGFATLAAFATFAALLRAASARSSTRHGVDEAPSCCAFCSVSPLFGFSRHGCSPELGAVYRSERANKKGRTVPPDHPLAAA